MGADPPAWQLTDPVRFGSAESAEKVFKFD